MLITFGGGIGVTFVVLRMRKMGRLGGAPTSRPSQMINTINVTPAAGYTPPLSGSLPPLSGSTTREQMTTPLSMAAAPMGMGDAGGATRNSAALDRARAANATDSKI